MGEQIEKIGRKPVGHLWDLEEITLNQQKPIWGMPTPGQIPIDTEVDHNKSLQQKRLYEERYKSTLGVCNPLQPLGTSVEQNKSLRQSTNIARTAPYGSKIDYTGKAHESERNPLQVAKLEKPKFGLLPPATALEPKGLQSSEKSALEPPTMKEKKPEKSEGIIHRFIDWITGVFKKRDNSYIDIDDIDGIRGKLPSPEQRNEDALRECLKRLFEALDKVKQILEEPAGANELIDSVKTDDRTKRMMIALMQKDMLIAQKDFKEAQKKIFEALNDTLWLMKFSKWMKIPEYLGTAGIVGAFGIAGAIVIASVATGGVGALVGALGLAATWFGITQGLGFLLQGFSKGVGAGVNYKVNSHKAKMTKARHDQEALTSAMQEDIKKIGDATEEISKMWEALTRILQGKQATLSALKN